MTPRLAGLALGVLLAVASAVLVQTVRQLDQAARRDATVRAEVLARTALAPELAAVDLSRPLRAADRHALIDLADSRMLGDSVVALIVWSPSGSALFGTAPPAAALGVRPVGNLPLAAALQKGAVTSGDPSLPSAGVRRFPKGTSPFAVYVPLSPTATRVEGSRPIVVEVDEALPGTTAATVAATAAVPLVGIGVLFAVLAALGAAGSLALRRENRAIRDEVEWLAGRHGQRTDLLDATVQSAEEERKRIARELHDGPVQHLSALALLAGRVEMAVDAGATQRSRDLLEELQREIGAEVEGIRRLMSVLRPPVLDARGLAAAIQDLAELVVPDGSPRCLVEAALPERLHPMVETVLYRVSQEALLNCVRHAMASEIRLRLAVVNRAIVLEVRDNGIGFHPPSAAGKGNHFGLIGMRERVESLGGRFDVLSRVGGGTTIRAVLSLRRLASLAPQPLEDDPAAGADHADAATVASSA